MKEDRTFLFCLRATMKNLIFPLSLLFLCAFFVSGCDLAQPINQGQNGQAAAPVEEPQQAEVPEPPPQVKESVPSEDNTEMVQAGRGMTGRGNYGTPTANNAMELITVPVATLFQMRERTFLLGIQNAMKIYQAEHNRKPASHAEYMREVIQKNNITMPQLPAGQEFIYDPRDGELKIRKPKDAP